jgi:hypothetical protein
MRLVRAGACIGSGHRTAVMTGVGVILKLSLGLLILYGLVVVVWYELLRSIVMRRFRRGRRDEHRAAANEEEMWDGVLSSENAHAAVAEHASTEDVDLDRARRRYHLARKAAKAERDAAIEAASEAAGQAIERIERRYREIDGAFIDEETEHISEMLRGSPGATTNLRARGHGAPPGHEAPPDA